MTHIFPVAVAVLECAAGIIYLADQNWRLAILWLGYGIAAFALAGVK